MSFTECSEGLDNVPHTTGEARVVAVDRLRPGDHACLDFDSDDERWQVLRVFAHDGFARGEKVVFAVTRAISPDEVADRIVGGSAGAAHVRRSGQFMVSSYARDTRLDAARTIYQTQDMIEAACREGYQGLRATGDMAWVLRPGIDLTDLIGFEQATHRTLFHDQRLTAICQYDRRRFGGQLMTTMHAIHSLSVLDRVGGLHVIATESGLRLAGECDMATRDELVTALGHAKARHAKARHEGPMVLDLTELSFLDGRCGADILRVAAAMDGADWLEVRCGPHLRRVFGLLGAESIPRLAFAVVAGESR